MAVRAPQAQQGKRMVVEVVVVEPAQWHSSTQQTLQTQSQSPSVSQPLEALEGWRQAEPPQQGLLVRTVSMLHSALTALQVAAVEVKGPSQQQ